MARVDSVQERLRHLEDEVKKLRSEVSRLNDDGPAITIRTITRDQAKEEILEMFRSGRTLYYYDFVRELGIDIQLIVEICDELESEGRIETLDDTQAKRRSTGSRKDLRRGAKNPKVASG